MDKTLEPNPYVGVQIDLKIKMFNKKANSGIKFKNPHDTSYRSWINPNRYIHIYKIVLKRIKRTIR